MSCRRGTLKGKNIHRSISLNARNIVCPYESIDSNIPPDFIIFRHADDNECKILVNNIRTDYSSYDVNETKMI